MQSQKILIIRTDRIGDVVLSTPIIKAARKKFPNAYLAMMVRPYAKDIILGNPYLDKIILYDKYKTHKSIFATLKFALNLKREHFTTALILHPTNRVNWITFLARIPERIGWNKKCGFLLTKKLPYIKHKGEKHESEYTMDLAKVIGIDGDRKDLFMPIREDARKSVTDFLTSCDVSNEDILIGIHPGASCPSKRWPIERFGQIADRIMKEFKCKVIILYGPGENNLAEAIKGAMKTSPIIAKNNFSVAELAVALKRCTLLVTNDNGPMHIATSVGTPVVAIFGRLQAGLSPTRWGSLGEKDVYLHKDVGCKECLAHNCRLNFRCLEAISVDEVHEKASNLLKN